MTFPPITLLLFFSASAIARNVGSANDADGPLDLTAYLERGEADKARKLSAVDPTLFAGVQSHAAFFNVNKTNKWHTFFWFFPAENKPLDSTPWIIWLGRGLGDSSLVDMFAEIGPLQITNGTVSRARETLNSNYSVLYIDHPVYTGFSYSEEKDKFVRNHDQDGQCLFSFIQQFLQVFPELQKAPLFIEGADFGSGDALFLGHYINKNRNSSISINLKGFVLGTPWIDPPSYLHASDLYAQIGLIDFDVAAKMRKYEEAARKAWKEGDFGTYLRLYIEIDNTFVGPLFVDAINAGKFTEDGLGFLAEFVPFLNQSKIRRALHVGNVQYNLRSDDVLGNLYQTFYFSVKQLLEDLLEHYGVLCYTGQLQVYNGYAQSEHMYRDLKWSGAQDYLKATRTPILSKHPPQTLNPIGYSRGAGNFVEVMVRSAAGYFPTGQPAAVKQVVETFIEKFK